MRRWLTSGALLLASGFAMPGLHGQASQSSDQQALAFDVVSIKPAGPGRPPLFIAETMCTTRGVRFNCPGRS